MKNNNKIIVNKLKQKTIGTLIIITLTQLIIIILEANLRAEGKWVQSVAQKVQAKEPRDSTGNMKLARLAEWTGRNCRADCPRKQAIASQTNKQVKIR